MEVPHAILAVLTWSTFAGGSAHAQLKPPAPFSLPASVPQHPLHSPVLLQSIPCAFAEYSIPTVPAWGVICARTQRGALSTVKQH
jgi:hypothetical protein